LGSPPFYTFFFGIKYARKVRRLRRKVGRALSLFTSTLYTFNKNDVDSVARQREVRSRNRNSIVLE
ncbi:hypothetical protein KW791_03375, partial [Candidatus Parcubacteria bacterium]|nr:hypothetical protein [Candidatus Parcubacteria bacterium]